MVSRSALRRVGGWQGCRQRARFRRLARLHHRHYGTPAAQDIAAEMSRLVAGWERDGVLVAHLLVLARSACPLVRRAAGAVLLVRVAGVREQVLAHHDDPPAPGRMTAALSRRTRSRKDPHR